MCILYPQVGRGLESKDSNDGSRINASNGITSIRSGVEGSAVEGFNPSQFAASPNSSRLPSLQQWASNHSNRQNEANLPPHPDSSDGSRIYEEVHLNDGKQKSTLFFRFPQVYPRLKVCARITGSTPHSN